jgi:hypothetical protein
MPREETCRGLERQDSCVHVIPDAWEVDGKSGGQASQKNVPASRVFVSCLFCHFQTSHPFSYSERNSGIPDAGSAMQPNETTLLSIV